MQSLSISYRRAEVIGFWSVGTLVVGLSISLLASALGLAAPWAWGLASAAALVMPGIVRRSWFEGGVWVWNGSVRRVAAVIRRSVLAVCYYVLFPAVGLTGSTFESATRENGSSSWRPRNQTPTGHDDPGSPSRNEVESDVGLSAFYRTRGNEWAIALRPLMFLLTLLRDEQKEDSMPKGTYTLY